MTNPLDGFQAEKIQPPFEGTPEEEKRVADWLDRTLSPTAYWYDTYRTADKLNVTLAYLRQLRKRGKFPNSRRNKHGKWEYAIEDIVAFEKSR